MTKQERIEKKQKEIEKQKEKLEKLAQQLKVLNQPTQKERKARTHRLCILGGVVEKFLKNTNKDLSNEEISQYLSELLQKADTGEKMVSVSTELSADEKRLLKLGQLVEKAAGRKIGDLNAFNSWILTQKTWIKG